jgi:hypothetical protein
MSVFDEAYAEHYGALYEGNEFTAADVRSSIGSEDPHRFVRRPPRIPHFCVAFSTSLRNAALVAQVV